jgi:hypothetical protein
MFRVDATTFREFPRKVMRAGPNLEKRGRRGRKAAARILRTARKYGYEVRLGAHKAR